MTPLLEVRQISKSFGLTRASVKASLTMNAGEIHAIVGEKGTGNLTLVKILAGVHSKDAGEKLLDGTAFTPASPGDARRWEEKD